MNLADQHFFSVAGFTLNPEEKTTLASSLNVKKHEEKFQNISLFAKISGTKGDYYLAYGNNKDLFNRKLFYW